MQNTVTENFQLYLLKFCEKEEYVDDILSGKLYMNASGYFRNLPEENDYRGDPFDGKQPIDVGDTEIYLEGPDGERLILNGVPWASIKNFSSGFSGDDIIPIWCACLMSLELFDQIDDKSFKLKKEYAESLSKFGEYIAIIPLGELQDKLYKFMQNHPGLHLIGKSVKYCDINKEYSLDTLNNENADWTIPFFTKDNAYKFQNEWRLIAVHEKKDLLKSPQEHWICDIGPFEYALKIDTETFINGTLVIEPD